MTNMMSNNHKTTRATRNTTRKTAFRVGQTVIKTSNLGGAKLATVTAIRPRRGCIEVQMNVTGERKIFGLDGRLNGSVRIEPYTIERAAELDGKLHDTVAKAHSARNGHAAPAYMQRLDSNGHSPFFTRAVDAAASEVSAIADHAGGQIVAAFEMMRQIPTAEETAKERVASDVPAKIIAADWLEAFRVADEIAQAAHFDYEDDEQKAAVAAVLHTRFLSRYAPAISPAK